MMGSETSGTTPTAPHGPLLTRLAGHIELLADEVALDVGESAVAVRPAVEFMLGAIAESDRLSAERLDELREEGSKAARQGLPLPALLDRYLSTGWVLWGGATREPGTGPEELTALGAALLRAVDAAAAALSDGHAIVEREAAARTAAATRQFLDEVVELRAGDTLAAERLARRAAHFGLDPWQPYEVVVIGEDRDLADDDPEVDELSRAIARPARSPAARDMARGPLVGARRGRLVVIAPGGWPLSRLTDALGRLAGSTTWRGVRVGAASLAEGGAAYVEASAALDAAYSAERATGQLLDAAELLLERALLGAPILSAAAVRHELGPVLSARGGQQLVATLGAYLASGQNVQATARALRLAPRTVTYRIQRVESLLDRRLRGDEWLRIAAALLMLRLAPRPSGDATAPRPRGPRRATPGMHDG